MTGVELSARYGRNEVHIIGLGIDRANPRLHNALAELGESRRHRAARILAKLEGLGVPVSAERLAKRTGAGTVGRIHVAQELQAMGVVDTVQAAFDKYLRKGRRAFVEKPALTCADAIELIHAAGGLAFIAHPGIGKTHALLNYLLKLPFDGVEAFHSRHSPGRAEEYKAIAEARGLLITGGSDCHGAAKLMAPEMGKVRLPMRYVEAIQARLATQRAAEGCRGVNQ